jgi:Effector Associated Constant Component 1
VDIAVTVLGGSDRDQARGLRRWLGEEEELRGRIQLLEPEPEPGQLGTLADTLIVSLGSGGAATVLASALVSWIRHRTGDTQAVLRKPDGSKIELAAQRIRGLDAAAVQSIVNGLTQSLGEVNGEGNHGDGHAAGAP